MQIIYESSFLKLVYFRSQELMEVTWLAATKEMTKQQYRAEFLTYLQHNKPYHNKKLLVDESQLYFNVDQEMQKWVNELFKKNGKFETEKLAIVFSKDFLQKINVKKMMSQTGMAKFDTLFFEEKEDAQKWLLTDKLHKKSKSVLLLNNNEYSDVFKFIQNQEGQGNYV